MSRNEQKQEKIVFKRSTSGIRDIPAVIRRGMRMNPSQLRFTYVTVCASAKATDVPSVRANANIRKTNRGSALREIVLAMSVSLSSQKANVCVDGH